jgi:carbonic anhydrase/acetyltransferase-like protein (isoleucine patch superfamily)
MKYKLTDETIEHCGVVLHRIQYLKDIPRHNVRAGDLGGYIESERNLSHRWDCVILGDAEVFENALVSGNAKVYEGARVSGNAEVYGNAGVGDSARVYDSARVSGNAEVYDSARVGDSARVYGDAVCTLSTQNLITVTDNHIAVGCEMHTFDYWIEHIEAIGKKHDYSKQDIKMYKLIIFQMIEARTGRRLIKVIQPISR